MFIHIVKDIFRFVIIIPLGLIFIGGFITNQNIYGAELGALCGAAFAFLLSLGVNALESKEKNVRRIIQWILIFCFISCSGAIILYFQNLPENRFGKITLAVNLQEKKVEEKANPDSDYEQKMKDALSDLIGANFEDANTSDENENYEVGAFAKLSDAAKYFLDLIGFETIDLDSSVSRDTLIINYDVDINGGLYQISSYSSYGNTEGIKKIYSASLSGKIKIDSSKEQVESEFSGACSSVPILPGKSVEYNYSTGSPESAFGAAFEDSNFFPAMFTTIGKAYGLSEKQLIKLYLRRHNAFKDDYPGLDDPFDEEMPGLTSDDFREMIKKYIVSKYKPTFLEKLRYRSVFPL